MVTLHQLPGSQLLQQKAAAGDHVGHVLLLPVMHRDEGILYNTQSQKVPILSILTV